MVRPPPSGPVEMEVEEEDPVANRARAIQSAARKAHVLDDVPIAIKKNKTQPSPAERVHQPFLTKRANPAKGKGEAVGEGTSVASHTARRETTLPRS